MRVYQLTAVNNVLFVFIMTVQLQYRLHRQSGHTKRHRRFAFIGEFPGSQSSGRDSPLSGCVLRPTALAAPLFK